MFVTALRARLEGSGIDDVGRRPAKPHHLPERDRREKGGERHGWPEKPTLPSSSSSLAPRGRAGKRDEREGEETREKEEENARRSGQNHHGS